MPKEAKKKHKKENCKRALTILIVIFFAILLAFGIVLSFRNNFLTMLPLVIFSLVGLLLTIYWKYFALLLIRMHKELWGKIIIVAIAVVIAVSVVIFIVISVVMITAARRPPPQNSTLILLGCQVRGETPSLMLTKRLEAALSWLRDNDDASAVLSGGQGPGEYITEAEAMRRWLTARGISDDRLFLEDRSTSTWENIRFSKNVIVENGLSTNVVIVTDGFHQHRAQSFAEREGLTAGAASAPTPWYVLPVYWFREAVAIAVQLS